MTNIFIKYIESKIPEVICETLKTETLSFCFFGEGARAIIFKININNEPFCLKVYKKKIDLKLKKIKYLYNILKSKNIIIPEILYSDNSNKYFKNGFVVSRWIEGIKCNDALNKNLISEEE